MNNERGLSNGALGLVLIAVVVVAASYFLLREESGSLLGAASGKFVKSSQQLKVTALKDLDPNGPRMTQIGVEPIMALIDELEARGSKVEISEIENSGLSTLKIKVDGREIAPVISECKSCEPIVFEY